MTPPIRRAAPAKLNLGLRVLRRRPDGFHDVETAMLPIGWADGLTAEPALALTLACSDPALPTDERNLVVRAALALAAEALVEPRAALRLDKRVPYGAGLGGGSSDAAAALLLLDRLWGTGLSESRLHALAAGLGSDVPFFLCGEAAIARGRGEVLTPLLGHDGAPYRCPFRLVVAVPPVHVATAEAYRLVAPQDGARPDLAAAVASNDLSRWRRELTNDFEAPILAAFPAIARAKTLLLDAGAGYAAMSGSGSAVFGAFEGAPAARAAAGALEAGGCRVWASGDEAAPP